MELIGTIQEELLKSAELTGLWEKKLRQIEKGTYEARTFLEELKQLVCQIVSNVFSDTSARSITIQEAVAEKQTETKEKKKPAAAKEKAPKSDGAPKGKAAKEKDVAKKETSPGAETKTLPENNLQAPSVKLVCPICHKGTILRGKMAYGCSEYKSGCTFRMDYSTYGPNLSDEELDQIIRS